MILKKLVQSFSICHWNLNSISLHDLTELLSLLRAHLSSNNFDVIFVSETYLRSDKSHEKANLEKVSYAFARTDHPSNTKQW